jgi:hypothetical protein
MDNAIKGTGVDEVSRGQKVIMKFWLYWLVARTRGIGRKYNRLPIYCSSISCGITKTEEMKVMFYKHGWKPYCVTRYGSSYWV